MEHTINLFGAYLSNGDLVFEISGDLPTLSFRSEGKIELNINDKRVIWKKNDVMFPSGFMVGNGRGLLAAIFSFHPTLSAIGSTMELGLESDSENQERVTVKTNLEINESIKKLLSNKWMLPKIDWIQDDVILKDSLTSSQNPIQSLAYGGGLDSGAAIAMFGEYTTPYHIVTIDSDVRKGTLDILKLYNGCVCESNLKLIYSISGFPHWCCPYIPALLSGSTSCSTGTILESQFTQDGKEYRDTRNNLWLGAMRMTGLIPTPIYFHSEFTNAKIVVFQGLQNKVAGNCIEEWGYSKKALRKAIILSSFDDTFFDFIDLIEEYGIILNPGPIYNQDAAHISSLTMAASLIKNPSHSKSVNNLQSITGFVNNSWAVKAHPEGLEEMPIDIKEAILETRKKIGIEVMTKGDIELLTKYEYQKYWLGETKRKFKNPHNIRRGSG